MFERLLSLQERNHTSDPHLVTANTVVKSVNG